MCLGFLRYAQNKIGLQYSFLLKLYFISNFSLIGILSYVDSLYFNVLTEIHQQLINPILTCGFSPKWLATWQMKTLRPRVVDEKLKAS